MITITTGSAIKSAIWITSIERLDSSMPKSCKIFLSRVFLPPRRRKRRSSSHHVPPILPPLRRLRSRTQRQNAGEEYARQKQDKRKKKGRDERKRTRAQRHGGFSKSPFQFTEKCVPKLGHEE